jgi:hypothetical protein
LLINNYTKEKLGFEAFITDSENKTMEEIKRLLVLHMAYAKALILRENYIEADPILDK